MKNIVHEVDALVWDVESNMVDKLEYMVSILESMQESMAALVEEDVISALSQNL